MTTLPESAAVGRIVLAYFRGGKRSNDTHASSIDPDAMFYKKGLGMQAKLCSIGLGLKKFRSGLLADARLTRLSKHA